MRRNVLLFVYSTVRYKDPDQREADQKEVRHHEL